MWQTRQKAVWADTENMLILGLPSATHPHLRQLRVRLGKPVPEPQIQLLSHLGGW